MLTNKQIADKASEGEIYKLHSVKKTTIYRTDISAGWVAAHNHTGNKCHEGIGFDVSDIMTRVAPDIGRVFVYDGYDKAGKYKRPRLEYPYNVPSNFVPGIGLVEYEIPVLLEETA